MLDELDNEWVTFQQCLIDSDVMLKKHKEKFKTGLIHSSEEFKKSVANLLDDFNSNGESYLMRINQTNVNHKLMNLGTVESCQCF